MGHIAPEAAKHMIYSGAVEGIKIDNSANLKSCNSCEYAKATRKPIQKAREMSYASAFGEEIHSDLWGPSSVQTPGKRECYVTFTDDHTCWSNLDLLCKKDETFKYYIWFEAWVKTQIEVKGIKHL
jgi:hypothetical protein